MILALQSRQDPTNETMQLLKATTAMTEAKTVHAKYLQDAMEGASYYVGMVEELRQQLGRERAARQKGHEDYARMEGISQEHVSKLVANNRAAEKRIDEVEASGASMIEHTEREYRKACDYAKEAEYQAMDYRSECKKREQHFIDLDDKYRASQAEVDKL